MSEQERNETPMTAEEAERHAIPPASEVPEADEEE